MRDVADGNAGFRYPKSFVFQAGQPEEITAGVPRRDGHESRRHSAAERGRCVSV